MSLRSVAWSFSMFAIGVGALASSAGAADVLPPVAPPRTVPTLIVPNSSVRHPEDAGLRARTNTLILKLDSGVTPSNEPFPGNYYETPASLACLYGVVARTTGCDPDTVTKNAAGGSKAVAIVDAYHDPYALADLTKYAAQFGLPKPSSSTVQVVYASGSQPAFDEGWYEEEALDVQMVYALAPKAKIYLVEAASNSIADLLKAEQAAAKLVAAAGGGEVTNSWGSDEFSAETSSTYAAAFNGTSTVFFASSGDSSVVSYPAALSTVVAVGGSAVRRNPATGAEVGFTTWTGAGAGLSLYVGRPSFQAGVSGVVGTHRGLPDVALDADPNTGVWVYLTYFDSWYIFGGTSVASPLMAAETNAAGHFAVSTTAELTAIYANAKTDFSDITNGVCYLHYYYTAGPGYDLCTGNGSPANLAGE